MPPTPQNSTIPAESASPPPLPPELLLRIFRFAASSNERPGIPENEMAKNIQQAAHTTAALSQTCKLFYALTKEVSLPRDAQRLITLIVEGKAAQAKAMIAANPELMFVKIKGQVETPGSGIDDEGLAFHGIVTAQSPLQVALGEGDADIYRHMASFFDKVLDENGNPIGRERAKNQFYEKLPDGIDYPPCEHDVNQARMPFSTIINAITNDTALRRDQNDQEWNKTRKPTEATKTVLRKFRKDFMPGIFTTGHHFNLNNLLEAFELYVQCFDNWNWNQRSLFWCQVIGYLQRLVPAVVAQAFCQGLYNLLERKQPLLRGLELHSWVTSSRVSYFGDSGHAGLGFDFGIYGGAASQGAAYVGEVPRLLKNYVEQKQRSLADLCSTWSNPSASNNLSCGPTRPQNGA